MSDQSAPAAEPATRSEPVDHSAIGELEIASVVGVFLTAMMGEKARKEANSGDRERVLAEHFILRKQRLDAIFAPAPAPDSEQDQ